MDFEIQTVTYKKGRKENTLGISKGRKMSNLVATVMDDIGRLGDTQRTHSRRVNDARRNEKISLFPFVKRRVVRSQQSPLRKRKKSHKIATRKAPFPINSFFLEETCHGSMGRPIFCLLCCGF
ncbi:hypothetical protein TNIN_116391 [Trichonephila inaurata madagascariensis]|uniref:Uncharacterized protein n=1 Tax=Trichonephila inaurata madagascariensis TaxID=2747483 RepID=A0A8X6YF54_9ARAC|nr:hypothetical protein TNIN_320181 [Trichonephila inaurata madagascariensis]GFY69553.1 hypothetical protein TNIN_116391 [Trichonephila inaurata madagascariensis]